MRGAETDRRAGTGQTKEADMKRWPIIRHIRFFYLRYRVNQHYDMWREMTGALPFHIQRDYDHLDRIWRGEA